MRPTSTLSLLGVFAASAVLAQPTITMSDVDVPIGTSITVHGGDYMDPGMAGTNMTWDFSAFNITNTATSQLVDPATTPYASQFPGATAASTSLVNPGSYAYTSLTAAGQYLHGNASGATEGCFYSNTEQYFALPLSMGTTWNDLWAANCMAQGQTVQRSGTTDGEVTGWGTVVMPYGTFNNVLRIEIHQVYSDVITGLNVDYDVTVTSFLMAGASAALLTSTTLEIDFNLGGPPQVEQFSQMADASAVGIAEADHDPFGISLFPNPATDQIQVTWNDQEHRPLSLRILNITGAEVRTVLNGQSGVGSATHDVSDLASGVYQMVISDDLGNTSVHKFIKP